MRRLILLSALLVILPSCAVAESINAGFVQGLWYDRDEFFVGDTIRVYVALRNNTSSDLSGVVTFYDNDHKMDSQSVQALNNRIIESWVDWTPTYGEHNLRVELSRVTLSSAGETENNITTLTSITATKFVDLDTDNDDVGNKDDIDDDGDGISDEVEKNNNTDPLVYTAKNEDVEEETDDNITETINVSEAGLERYLTPSRADTLLAGITSWASSTKAELDEYRKTRAANITKQATSTPIIVNNDGFGEITRSDESAPITTQDTEPKNNLITSIVTMMGKVINSIITVILFVVSWILGHPTLIQITLLFGLLIGIYKMAHKLGRRPT